MLRPQWLHQLLYNGQDASRNNTKFFETPTTILIYFLYLVKEEKNKTVWNHDNVLLKKARENIACILRSVKDVVYVQTKIKDLGAKLWLI